MKINSYSIGMDSARAYSLVSTRKLSFNVKNHGSPGDFNPEGYSPDTDRPKDYSTESGETYTESSPHPITYRNMSSGMHARIRQVDRLHTIKSREDVHNQFVLYLWQMLFGSEKAHKLAEAKGITPYWGSSYSTPEASPGRLTIYSALETYEKEEEHTCFSSNGQVETEDGRVLDFNLKVFMSSRFETYMAAERSSQIPSMIDPLVLNFSGDVNTLSDTTFFFDLNSDGIEEEIAMLTEGSGFLALDSNNDGTINNGSELFGTDSGDGFKDLAVYDEDHNGWIDENDEIFNKLRVWIAGSDGSMKLLPLKAQNVGAIYLGSQDTDFTLRGSNGNINGAIRQTGIFLYEDGTGVGLVNHLDIAN